MAQSRAQRRHDRERVIAARTSVAKNTNRDYFSGSQRITGGYFDTHKPNGSCGSTHCSLCRLEAAMKHEAVKQQRTTSRRAERLGDEDAA